jgi:hypothetical protein
MKITPAPNTAQDWASIAASRNKSVDDLLVEASKKPARAQNPYYDQAARIAITEGDNSRAKLIAAKISDRGTRQRLLDEIENRMLWNAIREDRMSEAEARISHIASPEQRLEGLVQLASRVASRGDKKRAFQYLHSAISLLASQPKSYRDFCNYVALARAYASLEPVETFRMTESLAPVINEIRAASISLDGFMGRSAFQDGEFLIGRGGTVESLVQQYASVLACVAAIDFERARADTDLLEGTEARSLARLAIVATTLR